jgi:hypothetical protein
MASKRKAPAGKQAHSKRVSRPRTTPKRAPLRKAPVAEKVAPALLDAVGAWVKSKGGAVLVAGGISIQKWPLDPELTFHVAVRCTGRAPIAPNVAAIDPGPPEVFVRDPRAALTGDPNAVTPGPTDDPIVELDAKLSAEAVGLPAFGVDVGGNSAITRLTADVESNKFKPEHHPVTDSSLLHGDLREILSFITVARAS